jgi:plasmid stability protein
MPKTTQLRNVPEELHRLLKLRAAQEGKSLSAYLIDQLYLISGIAQSTGQLTMAEMLARLRSREPVIADISSAEIIRELRGPLPPE